ncbi:MAG: iron-sulfur cluster assembly protein [Nitrosopumilus sp.]|nr:iron-sulfur cluster assembly protein [Nitrosopumilus sp.]
MGDDARQMRVKIFDELSKIVDPEINTTITELELIDEVDIAGSDVKVDLHLTSPFCPAVFGFKICQDIHDNLLKIDGIDDVKVNVSNHFMAEQINNQVNSSPNPKKAGGQQGGQQGGRAGDPAAGQAAGPAPPPSGGPA